MTPTVAWTEKRQSDDQVLYQITSLPLFQGVAIGHPLRKHLG